MIVYVDVDDTLVRSAGTKRIPMPRVIEHVRALHRDGAELYLWSSGGADYAKATAAEFGIDGCFVAFLPKPNLIIDDQEVQEWRYCRYEHPTRSSGSTGRTVPSRSGAEACPTLEPELAVGELGIVRREVEHLVIVNRT